MAGYGGFVMDLASQAVSSATTGADNIRQSLVGSVTGLAQSAQQRLLSYKYDPATRIQWQSEDTPQGEAMENQDFPPTDSPVWLLGRQLSAKYDLDELRGMVRARPWLTYRKEFNPIGSSGLTSDQGWGCMLRCGQMVLAGALLDVRLGRDWRQRILQTESIDGDKCSRDDEETEDISEGMDLAGTEDSGDKCYNEYQSVTKNLIGKEDSEYLEIMSKFLDEKSAQYSIHQIALMGESVDKKPVGTWFGPNLVAQVLRKLVKYDPSNDLVVHVAMDNSLILSEVRATCAYKSDGDTSSSQLTSWKPLLLFVSLRLGLSEINPVYVSGLKACLEFPQSLGVIGGRPNHALYLLGYVGEEVVYLDPHTTQPAMQRLDDPADAASYHCSSPGRINISQLDPSLSLCFLATTEAEFDNLCINIQEKLIEGCKTPLFEMLVERPPHMYSKYMSVPSDCSVQPDESTGQDYEQVERKYDSDNEFEIIE